MALDITPRLRRAAVPTVQPVAFGEFAPVAGPRRRQWALTAVLVALVAAVTVALMTRPSELVVATLLPVVVAAGLFLRSVQMYIVFTATALGLLTAVASTVAPPVAFVGLTMVMLLMVAVERQRSRRALTPEQGLGMLMDLRDRTLAKGAPPQDLPDGWSIDCSVLAAHDDPFAGDFVLTERLDERRLSLLLVDIAGSGSGCGTRTMMLAGAYSGLLGAVPADDLLPAANRHLHRQGWGDSYATAAHLEIDLSTGDFSLGSAGHPAAMQYRGGTGSWQAHEGASGVMLGVVDNDLAEFTRDAGRLAPGDALLLYSDGVVEARDGDLSRGLDRMLGAAERVLASGDGGTTTICRCAPEGESDDRTAILIRRG